MNDKLLTVADLAIQLSVKESWLYQNHRNLGLPVIKLGGLLRFDPGDVQAWLQEAKGSRPRIRDSVCITDSVSQVNVIKRLTNRNQQPSTESHGSRHES